MTNVIRNIFGVAELPHLTFLRISDGCEFVKG
jgi:hypothetical protein